MRCFRSGDGCAKLYRDLTFDADMKKGVKLEFADTIPNRGIKYPAGAWMGYTQVILHDFWLYIQFWCPLSGHSHLPLTTHAQHPECHTILCINWLAVYIQLTDGCAASSDPSECLLLHVLCPNEMMNPNRHLVHLMLGVMDL